MSRLTLRLRMKCAPSIAPRRCTKPRLFCGPSCHFQCQESTALRMGSKPHGPATDFVLDRTLARTCKISCCVVEVPFPDFRFRALVPRFQEEFYTPLHGAGSAGQLDSEVDFPRPGLAASGRDERTGAACSHPGVRRRFARAGVSQKMVEREDCKPEGGIGREVRERCRMHQSRTLCTWYLVSGPRVCIVSSSTTDGKLATFACRGRDRLG